MTASTDHRDALWDRETERILKMTEEELAADEGITVQELRDRGARLKAEILAKLRARGLIR